MPYLISYGWLKSMVCLIALSYLKPWPVSGPMVVSGDLTSLQQVSKNRFTVGASQRAP